MDFDSCPSLDFSTDLLYRLHNTPQKKKRFLTFIGMNERCYQCVCSFVLSNMITRSSNKCFAQMNKCTSFLMNFKWSHNQFFFTELITNLLEIKILQSSLFFLQSLKCSKRICHFFTNVKGRTKCL